MRVPQFGQGSVRSATGPRYAGVDPWPGRHGGAGPGHAMRSETSRPGGGQPPPRILSPEASRTYSGRTDLLDAATCAGSCVRTSMTVLTRCPRSPSGAASR